MLSEYNIVTNDIIISNNEALKGNKNSNMEKGNIELAINQTQSLPDDY